MWQPEQDGIHSYHAPDSFFSYNERNSRDDRAIDSFCACTRSTRQLAAARSLAWRNPLLVARAKVEAESEKVLEELLDCRYSTFVILADDIDEGLVLACLLYDGRDLDYFVSPSSAKGLANSYGEKHIEDERRGRILVDYLTEFEKEKSIIVGAESFNSSLQNLCSCSDIKSIVVVSSLGDLKPSVPVLTVKDAESEIFPHDNDRFKRLFLEAVDNQTGDSFPRKAYAYLLNNIDTTDTLDTVREIVDRMGHHELKGADERYGTSILYHAITCRDHCRCSVIANGGGVSGEDVSGCVDIVRFLASCGLRYKKEGEYEGIGGMAFEMYNAWKLAIMFRTLMECGYSTTNDELFEFMAGFISSARCNDHIVSIDASHGSAYWQRLDKARCEQFDTMFPFIPDEVFSMRDCEGSSLLMIAAKYLEDLPKLFKRILERSPDIDAIDEDGCSAFHYVSNAEEWDALIAAGADIEVRDKMGRLPSLEYNQEEIAEFLAKGDYSDNDRKRAESMLFSLIDQSYDAESVYNNSENILRLLDIAGPEARSGEGESPLMALLIQQGYFPELYDRMLEAGVDINAVDSWGNSTLRLTVLSPECTLAKIRYLVSHGAKDSPARPSEGSVATVAAGLFHIKSPEWNALWELPDRSVFTYHNKDAMSPIMTALHYLNMDAIRFLFTHDAVPLDELEKIEARIGKIKSKATKAEVLEYFFDYKKRNGI